jgi:hypothetical protein
MLGIVSASRAERLLMTSRPGSFAVRVDAVLCG